MKDAEIKINNQLKEETKTRMFLLKGGWGRRKKTLFLIVI